MFLKVCGITEAHVANHLVDCGVDALGFIFYEKSKRYITPQEADEIQKSIGPSIKKIGVFVNETLENILDIAECCQLDYIQLHGTESPEFCANVQKFYKVIKAFGMHDDFDLSLLNQYKNIDICLLDTYFKGASGGTGKQFNWQVLEKIELQVPIMVSGGLNCQNVSDLLHNYDAWGLDFNSGLELSPGIKDINKITQLCEILNIQRKAMNTPDQFGHFNQYGGKYVPETLIPALTELEEMYLSLKDDPSFIKEYKDLLKDYVGRENPLTYANQISSELGFDVYLKREDLNHTGAHKINNAIGQILLAKKMGKTKIIAETGAGQHGVATATVAAKFGMECMIYMGEEDIQRQKLNVFRMELLGAKVVPVSSGSKTLKDATNEAIRDWVASVEDTYYLIGSVVGPHPYPMIVRDFQCVIGDETRRQFKELSMGEFPDHIIACVGGGSNAIGMFHPFLKDKVRLIGVEAAGFGVETDQHAATLTKGRFGVLHGSATYVLQDQHGQIQLPHSISAGLDYPGIGPEHAYLKDTKRVEYKSVTDQEAIDALKWLCEKEGILPALESSHAIALLRQANNGFKAGDKVVVCLSGRGDKDVHTVAQYLGKEIS